MGMRSRRKGKVGELEAAAEIRKHLGAAARRGCQYAGGDASPDIVTDLPGVHFEVKRTESFRLYDALDQATADAGEQVPVVLHRPNHRPWVAIVKLSDLPQLAVQIYLKLMEQA